MNISSMTGFARVGGEIRLGSAALRWNWEIKSVNGKALEIKTKLPPQADELMPEIKNTAGKFFRRGNVSILLEMSNSEENPQVRINEELLKRLSEAALRLYETAPEKLQKPQVSELLSMRGVVEVGESELNEEEQAALKEALLADFTVLCGRLQDDRRKEGGEIKAALKEILRQIGRVVGEIKKIAQTLPAQQKKKLSEQVRQWMDPGLQLSEERLAQELVLYVTKADIQEEVDRLQAHLATAEKLLDSEDAVGRRLDFLCQELNREANTTCAKSTDIELTNRGMELKALIEQFREQVQNIE